MCTPKRADAPRSFERRYERRTVFARAAAPSQCRCTWGHPSPSSPKMEGRHVLDLPSSQSEKSISCLPVLGKQGGRNPRIQHRVWKWGRCADNRWAEDMEPHVLEGFPIHAWKTPAAASIPTQKECGSRKERSNTCNEQDIQSTGVGSR